MRAAFSMEDDTGTNNTSRPGAKASRSMIPIGDSA